MGGPQLLENCANPHSTPLYTGSAPGMEAASHVPSVQPWAGLVLWASCGCSSSCVSSICHLLSLFSPPEPGRFACHCAACCSVLSLLSHFAVTGAFWGFPASVLYIALCEPHHPFSLCLGSFQKWGDQLWCSWSQSDMRRGTWACVSFLVS